MVNKDLEAAAESRKGQQVKIKSILGFCQYKGCKRHYDYEVELKYAKKGKIRSRNLRLCMEHAKELCQGGKIRSLTYQETIDFE